MKNTFTFKKILQVAQNQIEAKSQKQRDELIEELEHGKGFLTTNEQLDMYLNKYGAIHQAKLLRAFVNIPQKLWYEGNISIVDYGAGQGVAEMVLSDYLQTIHVDNDIVKNITLIEPSRACIIRSVNY